MLPPGMSLAQARTLAPLPDWGPRRLTDLAKQERVAQPTMTALIGRMERQGWVERGVDDVDRRVVLVHMTQAGREVLREGTQTRARVLQACLDVLPEQDRTALAQALRALEKVIALAQERKVEPS